MTQEIINIDIKETSLPVRVKNCLAAGNIKNVEQLLQLEVWQLKRIPNLGMKSAKEIIEYVNSLGYELKGQDSFDKNKAKLPWVTKLIDEAVAKERENCSDRVWMALIKHGIAWNVRQDVTSAIMLKVQNED